MSDSLEMAKLRKKYIQGKAELEQSEERRIVRTIETAIALANDAASKGLVSASVCVDLDIVKVVWKRLKDLHHFKVRHPTSLSVNDQITLEISGWADEIQQTSGNSISTIKKAHKKQVVETPFVDKST